MDYQRILEEIHREILPFAREGRAADYIPALAAVDPDQFGICMRTIDGRTYCHEQADTRFSIQSITKVFSLAMAFGSEGDALWRRVGREPSGTAFNSLIQLEVERGIPRNPFINAGAIVVADVLLERFDDPEGRFLSFVRALSGNMSIDYDERVARSEREKGYLIAAIANLLK